MAGKTHGDRLLELERIVTRLEMHVETIREQIGGLPEFGVRVTAIDERIESRRHTLDRISAELNAAVGRIQEVERQQRAIPEKKLEELRSRRWELIKLVVAAILGSALTLAAGLASKALERIGESKSSATAK